VRRPGGPADRGHRSAPGGGSSCSFAARSAAARRLAPRHSARKPRNPAPALAAHRVPSLLAPPRLGGSLRSTPLASLETPRLRSQLIGFRVSQPHPPPPPRPPPHPPPRRPPPRQRPHRLLGGRFRPRRKRFPVVKFFGVSWPAHATPARRIPLLRLRRRHRPSSRRPGPAASGRRS